MAYGSEAAGRISVLLLCYRLSAIRSFLLMDVGGAIDGHIYHFRQSGCRRPDEGMGMPDSSKEVDQRGRNVAF
jgi:hypothetical protein